MIAQEWAVLPFSHKKIKDKYLVTNRFGSWTFLQKEELQQLRSVRFTEDSALFAKLEKDQIILTSKNVQKLITEYRQLNANLFLGPSLIIVSLTSYCNFGCSSYH